MSNSTKTRDSALNAIKRYMAKSIDEAFTMDAENIASYLQLLSEQWVRFNVAQDAVEITCGADVIEIEENVRIQAETWYSTASDNFSRVKNCRTKLQDSSTKASLSTVIRLPKMELPTLSGDSTEWIGFFDAFSSLVDSNSALSYGQKLHYLRSCLKGDALKIISGFKICDANYVEAWGLLTSRYKVIRVIVESHLRALAEIKRATHDNADTIKGVIDAFQQHNRELKALGRLMDFWDNWLCLKYNPKTAQKESASALRSLLDGVTSSIRALQHLGRPVEQWDDWLIFTTIHKLDPITRKAWELSLKSNDSVPTFRELEEFLASRTQSLEIVQSFTEDKPHPSSKRVNNLHGVSGYHTTSNRCSSCSGKHFIMFCGDFLKLSPNERYQCILKRKLCINCLRGGHQQSCCTSARRCYTCNAKHHTMLHEYFASTTANSSTNPVSLHHVRQSNHKFSIPQVILGTALVEVRSECGHVIVLRALLDSGAEATFISEYAVNSLCLPKSNVKVSINGANGSRVATAKGLVTFTLHSLKNLDLADPKLTIPKSIDIILNGENYAAVLLSGTRRSCHNNLVAQNTQLEELNSATSLTEEERFVEEYFQNTTCRRKDGRYIVRLPIKRDVDLKQLITTQCDAVALHGNLQRRLSRDASMRTMYTDFMYEYLSLKHMQLITGNINCLSPVCFLPHHGVLKASSTTTKLRVVFNASKKCSSGKSLNDCLYPGPKLQNDLTAVVMNWRRYQIALTGDITKMYRQILVDERDVDLQRIVWCPTKHEHPSHYRLNTVTYGTSCAPYLAIKVLHTLASDEKCNFPEATQILLHEFYVDDVLTGADNVADACRRRSELQTLLQARGFTLCKWNSNSTEILQTIDPNHLEFKTSHEFQMDQQSNTLGLVWTPKSDCLTFTLKLDYTIATFTKRQLLSDIAKLFDPLGF
ncbi:uncharacterized protein LOC129251187 [Anastrepha obliqua]|uniref:uncharacterized protein LOC129251187 n=1 Tax=Anastrepha obliqua TaxID=95512 RepID=UPI0024099702|nr:uncharacterized protein LOC129251187 [Anastrepha obliqua]